MSLPTRSPVARAALDWFTLEPEGVNVKPVVSYRGRALYALQRKQLEAWKLTPLWRSRSKSNQPTRIGYGGAAGGGKSYLADAVAVGVAMAWPGSVTIIFRKTRIEAWRNHVVPLRETLPRELATWNGSTWEFTFRNGSRIVIGYLRNERDHERYQGDAYDCMIFEEATHYYWSQVSWLLGNRLRSSGAPGSVPFALFPSNPGNIGHWWFKRLFVDREYDRERNETAKDHAFVQSFLKDNEILRARDPGYEAKLDQMPEPMRSWLRDGDFSAGAGMAIHDLAKHKHLVKPFEPPESWTWFGGFDWGFSHPWVLGLYVADEDGRVFKVDTYRGRRQTIRQIISTVQELANVRGHAIERLQHIEADRIIFSKRGQEIGYDGPTYAEIMMEAGLPVTEANNERIRGLQRLREWVQWRGVGPVDPETGERTDDQPFFYLMDTPGNRKCYRVLESMVTDPNRPEDVLKVDADETGEGGDDEYDETRYALASRPTPARSSLEDREISAFDPEVLAHEAKRVVKDTPLPRDRRGGNHPEFGGYY